ncbi:hypothetical protein FHG87_004148 [Trinorchestia longiramus]|nr:hypothetical protein FHG87_004148 [Trinorchestia longiramus]
MTSNWKENCKQPCLTSRKHGGSKRLSKIAFVEDDFELPVCALYPLVDQHKSYQGASVALQTLDASLLLGKRTNQLPRSSSQVPSTSDHSSVTDVCPTLASERLAGGFDNTAFDLDSLQHSFSRRDGSLTDENGEPGYQFCDTDSNLESKIDENTRHDTNHKDIQNFLPYSLEVQDKNDGHKSDSSYGSRPKIKRNAGVAGRQPKTEGNKGVLERVEAPEPCGKLRRGRPCQLPLRTFSEINANPTPSRTLCVPWTAEANAIRKQLNDIVVNNAFVTDSESSDDSSLEENIDYDDRLYRNRTMTSSQKTECVAEKTESRSQWRNYGGPVSTEGEMVQVGCISRPLSGHYTNSISVSNREPYLRNVNTVAVSASVSSRGINFVNPVRTVGKISNDVRGSCSITTTPTVSALTKVSSVRIVPTPTATPTPSVTGASENGSAKLALPLQRVPLRQYVHDLSNTAANVSTGTSKQLETVPASGSVQHSEPSVSLGSPSRVSASLDLKVSELPASRESSSDAFVPVLTIPNRSSSVQSPPTRDFLHSGAQIVHQSHAIPVSAATSPSGEQSRNVEPLQTELTSPNSDTQTSPEHVSASLPPPGTSRPTTSQVAAEGDGAQRDADVRRGDRERRRERRERRRERRAQRMSGALLLPPPPLGVQTEVGEANTTNSIQPNARLPDLLNSHVPPPYSTLPNGPRSHGALLPPPHPPGPIPSAGLPPGGPPGLPLHLQHPPPGAPVPPGYPPPPTPGSPIRPPPDCPWPFFGSRR